MKKFGMDVRGCQRSSVVVGSKAGVEVVLLAR